MEIGNVIENVVVDNTTTEENSVVANNIVESNEVVEEKSSEITENINTDIVESPVLTSEETSQEISSEINTTIIEEKLDNIIALESQQMSTSLICTGLLIAGIVIYLLYKFITNFFEF